MNRYVRFLALATLALPALAGCKMSSEASSVAPPPPAPGTNQQRPPDAVPAAPGANQVRPPGS